jgi:general secretion pathway protein G
MPHAREKKGFTLVEMLAVLFIVSILLGIVLGSARYANQISRVSRAESDLQTLADALDRFQLVFGEYPPVDSATNLVTYKRDSLGYSDSAENERGEFAFAKLLPKGFTAIDPWSHSYLYRVYNPELGPGAETKPDDDTLYILASLGPDGKEGTDDDISPP